VSTYSRGFGTIKCGGHMRWLSDPMQATKPKNISKNTPMLKVKSIGNE